MRRAAVLAVLLLWCSPAFAVSFAPFRLVAGTSSGSYTAYSADTGSNNLYLNSSELGASRNTTQDPDIVFADDFEDQAWYSCDCDNRPSSISQDGWCGTVYSGTTSGSCPNGPNVLNAIISGGAVGSSWAGNYGSMASTSCGSGCAGNMAEHELGPTTQTGYNELWIRFYWQFSSDFVLQGNTKLLTFKTTSPGTAGFDIGSMGTGENSDRLPICPQYDCNTIGYVNPQNTGAPSSAFLWPNMGSAFHFDDYGGHWIATEVHIKLETTAGVTQDGMWEVWADDCGVDGLSCPNSLTQRASFTNIRWRVPGNTSLIRTVWFEGQRDYRTGSSYDGTNLAHGSYLYVDQIMIKKANGPIGPVQLPN